MTLRAFLSAALLASQPAIAEELILDTKQSLTSLEISLAAIDSPRAVDRFALGAVGFLRAIEVSLQERYRTNAALGYGMIGIPVLRLPVPPNPAPEPFTPDFVTSLFADVDSAMDRTRTHLDGAALEPDDKLVIDIAALWFDVDGDGARGVGEGALEVAAAAVGDPVTDFDAGLPTEGLIVHFDAADAEWLAAYTHLLSAVSQVVMAFDPTDVIAEVMTSTAKMADIQAGLPPTRGWFTGEEAFVDAFATVYGALNRVPAKENIGAARDHLLEMIDRNRAFWALVDAETDNAFEWIPNESQEASLGFALPPETSAVWRGVLADAEAVLKGELLVPHWRISPGGGINVAKMVVDPPAFDLVTWIQGSGLTPYMEPGPQVTWESYARFTAMFRGEAVLFMVLLN
ncbi:hypothetical protein [Jannaschia seohaensis]|uniref:Uncharacterized protein n=1 Tax=Jannaschia seohaensis TaxID=475081 RepID=A0A2Y9A5T9_9RHOB|nr:hypothetical protein [Jannaschia seohaensis]PWJ21661.1 hypothetical protein BCF38_10166 [Jannaschia seohaensis]SSA37939.1 hypothetical protein SAMN05421539_10166 [Jannaschia seohaensis]